MFCSTIIPTTNRSSLSRAVHSVLDQDLVEPCEIIVVNDSGKPLPFMDWQNSDRVRVIDTNRRERCVARNAGAALATGEFLHFLDDDDIMLPGSLTAFWNLAQTSPAAIWLHGSYQTVDNDGNVIDEFHPDLTGNILPQLIAGEAVPFQTSLLHNHHFFAAGGFRSDLVGVEDRDLGRRLAILGDVAFIPAIVVKIRIGEVGSTTNWRGLGEGDRRGRENAMIQAGVLRRLYASGMDTYWHGRVSRAYLASTIWNLKHGRLDTAVKRAAVGCLIANWRISLPDFWTGMRTKIK
jgi:glycosyltransferase involved in cell wall biosynthesis